MIRTCSLFFVLIVAADCFVAADEKKNTRPMEVVEEFVERFCIDCHSGEDAEGGMAFTEELLSDVSATTSQWERVVRKLRVRQMPPADELRPENAEYDSIVSILATRLDQLARQNPNPGRTNSIRRLTRFEYQNAIRDLLHLEIDVSLMLPTDESSHGFDNVTVGNLSPSRLNRFLLAAQKISRLAVGRTSKSPRGDTIRIPADRTQEAHVDGLPLGTRGGALIPYTFPQTGAYEITIRLARDRNEEVEGLKETHHLEILLDRQLVQQLAIQPPRNANHSGVDEHLKSRFQVTAGPHQVGVTFLKKPSSLLETKRQPYLAHFNKHRHPRQSPAIFQVSIVGPFTKSVSPDTPSRRQIYIAKPQNRDDVESCAKKIFANLMRRAYRRQVTPEDFANPMKLFRQGCDEDGFDAGIELGLSSILVSPHFLLRIEKDPKDVPPETTYPISDLELASRLSFFLWSSIPDDELLSIAIGGDLREPQIFEQQVRRLLADHRSKALAKNFTGQWLYLKNLESTTPDLRKFPDFDDNLRRAFQQETELFFASVMQEDRNVLQLLNADYTFLNERLAKHYEIPHIYGSRFRRVALNPKSHRGGILRHGSILTVTSYATRTSPVIRGHWMLKNLIGAPPPPPPPNVPELVENMVLADRPMRERLAEHRENSACANCHQFMDPIGFAWENYDAIGRWRTMDAGARIDATGEFSDGSAFDGIDQFQQILISTPDLFVATLTEKLMTYALGRGLTEDDAPAIRQIVASSQEEEYRFSSIIMGIVNSAPFQFRRTL